MRASLSWLAYTGIIAGGVAASLTLTSALFLGGAPSWRAPVIAFTVTMSSYTLDRLIDLARDGNIARANSLRGLRGLRLLNGLAFLSALALGFTSEQPLVGVVTLLFPLSVALYSAHWIPWLIPALGRQNIRRIKDIPYAKAVYVPACWSGVVALAALLEPRSTPLRGMMAALFVFATTFVAATACDLRDIQEDARRGVRTIPARFGATRAMWLLQAVNLATVAIPLLGVAAGVLPRPALALALYPLPVALYLHRMGSPGADLTFYSDVIADAAFLVQPLLAFAGLAFLES
jgi:4-hydroxybenzoate polyprenyltransferase